MIPKANGKMRALGIPCLRDKIIQEAIRMALEPIYEAEFHDSSYGFRPNRSTTHAIARCQHAMLTGFTWVIEGDVKACFDEISHKAILGCLREKVMDNRFLQLIRYFLKSGVEVHGIVQPTEKGVPQGGVASPLLANVVLNRLDWFLHGQGHHGQACDRAMRTGRPNIRFVRYADDWCVFITRGSKRYAERLRDRIREMLHRDCGVRLSDEKTRITHVRDGFGFLGFHMTFGIGKGGHLVPKIKVPRKATTRIVQRLNEAIRFRPLQESGAARIVRGSAVIRGWSNYFRIANNFSQAANVLDHQAFWIATKTLSRKFGLSTATCLKRHRFGSAIGISESCMLMSAQEVKMVTRLQPPELYRPGTGCYLEDLDWEVDFRLMESRRPGRMDTKALALFRDGYRCRKCGVRVTYGNSQADHIVPVRRFANFRQADVPTNIQILCLACHQDKTAKSR